MLVLWCCHMFLLSYYIIFMYFVGLTYWQDAQCQFPVFVLILLQKVTSGNILVIGRKFTMIFYCKMKTGAKRAAQGEAHRLGATPSHGLEGGHSHHPPLPCGALSSRLFAYKFSLDLKPTTPPEDFSRNGTELRHHHRQVLRVRLFLFRHPAGMGIGPRSHLHRHRCLRAVLWVVPPWTTGHGSS